MTASCVIMFNARRGCEVVTLLLVDYTHRSQYRYNIKQIEMGKMDEMCDGSQIHCVVDALVFLEVGLQVHNKDTFITFIALLFMRVLVSQANISPNQMHLDLARIEHESLLANRFFPTVYSGNQHYKRVSQKGLKGKHIVRA